MNDENKIPQLTDKQLFFCQEYVKDFNATQAAIRAGYSEKTAYSIGGENLRKPEIQEYISQLQKEIQERNKITIDECVSIFANIARFDIADLYNEDGGLKSIHEIPPKARTAIMGIESEQLFEYVEGEKLPAGVLKKIRTISKEGVIDKLLKHLGGYEKDTQKQPKIDLSKLSPETLMQIWNARSSD